MKKTVGIILIILSALRLWGLSGNSGVAAHVVITIVIMLIGIALIVFDRISERKNKEAEKKIEEDIAAYNAAQPVKQPIVQTESNKDFDLLPVFFNDYILTYSYEKDICFIDKNKINSLIGKAGKQIEFEFEDTNEYDEKAIKINLDDEHIGYVYKGQTQDMIHDWYKNGWEVCAHINKYSVSNGKATYKIGFYKPADCFDSREFKLTRITKKADEFETSRFEALESTNENTAVDIEYYSYEDSYVVTNDCGEEIGAMPKSFAKFDEENDYKAAIISEIETYDGASALITIYY